MSVHAEDSAPPPRRLVYSIEEAADLLGMGRTFMYHLVATGEIDSFKIGTRRKIPREAIEDYIERLRADQLGDRRPERRPRSSPGR